MLTEEQQLRADAHAARAAADMIAAAYLQQSADIRDKKLRDRRFIWNGVAFIIAGCAVIYAVASLAGVAT